MIYIKDNFLEDSVLEFLTKGLNDFQEVDAGDKKFWVMMPPPELVEYITSRIALIEGRDIDHIFSFFRVATDKLDTDWRIHNDSIIENQLPDRAIVLYVSDSETDELHGTAFWEHQKYGDALLKDDLTPEEFNRLLIEDANDLSQWTLKTVVGYKKNRLVSYPCNYFHSKYPNKSWESGRKVFAMFYKIKEPWMPTEKDKCII